MARYQAQNRVSIILRNEYVPGEIISVERDGDGVDYRDRYHFRADSGTIVRAITNDNVAIDSTGIRRTLRVPAATVAQEIRSRRNTPEAIIPQPTETLRTSYGTLTLTELRDQMRNIEQQYSRPLNIGTPGTLAIPSQDPNPDTPPIPTQEAANSYILRTGGEYTMWMDGREVRHSVPSQSATGQATSLNTTLEEAARDYIRLGDIITVPQEPAIIVDDRVPIPMMRDDMESYHYMPHPGTRMNVPLFIINIANRSGVGESFPVTPTRSGNIYQFTDAAGRVWVNHVQYNRVRYDGSHVDDLAIRWMLRTEYLALPEIIPMSSYNGDSKRKLRKKLHRKVPIPEIKEEKHYANKRFIA